ncbi:cadmium/zinc/cobalt-transporting ATPase [Emticicia aquatilis]|uniref:P-type Zn(2+) transporter n=1 Tax=Emticicia aquatilis TaxID=1537369 RepID=A0A917DUV3_9BACT|nr:heavy metal translocating P-type ATPase [Emticicia aquatilis]GGD73266.1 cadmium/zinc/cobalt-transporting ATPase [Emticicia aquatilis]
MANEAEHNHDEHNHSEEHSHDHSHEDSHEESPYLYPIISLILLLLGIGLDYFYKNPSFWNETTRIIFYGIAFLLVGWDVLKIAFQNLTSGNVFTEFFLMSIATLGAFYIGEYPEGVAVMLFYAIGELFQGAAVSRAKRNIKALLDVRPNTANVFRENTWQISKPETIKVGEKILVKVGEKVPLDGIILTESSSFDTSALTGESKPQTIKQGEQVLAGMINLEKIIEVEVSKLFTESSIARILELVQNATSKKAPTELFIRKFAKIYTPIVVFLAIGLVFLPYFFIENYTFHTWLYRALIFLVISCPCALVISIPLGYFGGIGAASRNGILFKGSNYLDLMAKVTTVVMDKTGTLTKGVFKVQEIKTMIDEKLFLQYLKTVESHSTHPVAKAIIAYVNEAEIEELPTKIEGLEEISGHGMKGIIHGQTILVGNLKLLKKFDIIYGTELENIVETIVVVAIDSEMIGYVLIADQLKDDAQVAIQRLRAMGIQKTIMLSGDKSSIVQKTASLLGISAAYGDLLPENKVEKVQELKADASQLIAFVGDGINDAPVLALADVGIAMGGLGSDVAIETADVVIQTDQPSKIATAINISKKTKQIVWQNIGLAFGVKAIVLILGAGGLATMWEAVFADVGVALLAILNAVRVQNMKF